MGETAASDHVRLIYSAEHFLESDIRRYMTVSHRWGQSEMLKLATSNEMTFRKCIPSSCLPKTFQHAVELARQLGVRYLWIDALCIIQDSKDDWLKESSTMADVYKNAYCNIAATSATNSNGGLFFPRNPNLLTTNIFVRPAWPEANQREFVFTQPPHQSIFEQLEREPLLDRGWVLQERYLAARVLHFTTDRVFFECHHHLVCEEFPNGIPDIHGELCSHHPEETFLHRQMSSKEEANRGERREILEWNNLIKSYTKCSLTFSTDKLMALSGITTHFSRYKLPHDDYFAGIWRSQLPSALLWRGGGSFPRKKEPYQAPTWSWASLDGAIDMDLTERTSANFHSELAEVLEVCVTTLTGNPTGPPSSGFIRLRAVTAVIAVRKDKIISVSRMDSSCPKTCPVPRRGKFRTAKLTYDIPVNREREDKVPKYSVSKSSLWRHIPFRNNNVDGVKHIPIVLIKCNDWEGPSGKLLGDRFMAMGLALSQLEDGTFQRLGYVSFWGDFFVPWLLKFLGYPDAKDITIV